jgi:hypothetical protein
MTEATSFVRMLAAQYPEIQELLDEHIRDNLGEILPHVFFGDVTRYLVALANTSRAGSDEARGKLQAILNLLEIKFSAGPREVVDLLSASFLENLPRAGEDGSDVRTMLGPSLTKELKIIG